LFDLFDFVSFTGESILTGFGRDQAVKRCVAEALALVLHFVDQSVSEIRNLQLYAV
jgi:hypothetical protein